MKRWGIILLAGMLCLLGGCAEEEVATFDVPSPIVTIEMEDGSVMQAELYPAIAPNTVANFVDLIGRGFYDGLTFHRVIGGFMIQGGDPMGTGMGGPDYTIKGEFAKNGVENALSHTRGVLSMARTGSDLNSAGSQFFIMHGTATYLDGEYAAFGKLIGDASYEALDVIANTATDASEKPMIERKIKKVTVDTKGYAYTVAKYEAEE